jgi:hypothetical protein
MESGGESSECFKPGDVALLTEDYMDLVAGEPIAIHNSPMVTSDPWGRAFLFEAGEYNKTLYCIPRRILQKVIDASNS